MITWHCGNNIAVMRRMKRRSVQCVVTSPPYFGLRSYDTGFWVGGDPHCKHRPRVSLKSLAASTLGGGKKTTAHQQEPISGRVCPYCGAVRMNEIWGGDSSCKHIWGSSRSIADGNAPSKKSTLNGGFDKMRSQPEETDSGCFCTKCDAWQGELGNEPTPELYIQHMVEVFRAVRNVLRDDGCLFINIGDSFCRIPGNGVKQKDLLGIPWMLAFALRADGWYLRSEIIWSKLNGLPESATDRPTKMHEQIFLLTKKPNYTFYQDAVREPCTSKPGGACFGNVLNADAAIAGGSQARRQSKEDRERYITQGRNLRSVWSIPTESFSGEHFAPFPKKLVQRCLLASTKKGDTILDCFGGSGTSCIVAEMMGRNSVYIDLNMKYLELAKTRQLTESTGGMKRKPICGGFFSGKSK